MNGVMDDQYIGQLAAFCEQVYQSSSPNDRRQAENVLNEFMNSSDALEKCIHVLKRAPSTFTLLWISSCLMRLLQRERLFVQTETKLEIRNLCLNYLANQPNELYVTQSLTRLLVKVVKLGWFESVNEEHVFRKTIDDVQLFLKRDVPSCSVGVYILSCLIDEINESSTIRSLVRQRKIVSSFRDESLKSLFTLGLTSVKQLSVSAVNSNQESSKLMENVLQLLLACLTFDFIGTAPEESTDDTGTLQIPTAWRPAFISNDLLPMFYDLAISLPPTLSEKALQILVQLVSVRRSLFSTTERKSYLQSIMDGIKKVLDNGSILSEPACYHQFCRLLAKLKCNYQLNEIVDIEGYEGIIDTIAKFTISSLENWHFSSNSIHYLLSLWQRLCTAVPYVKSDKNHYLPVYAPQISKTFLKSRLELVLGVLRDGLEDPLDDVATLHQQLDLLSTVVRIEYPTNCNTVIALLEEAVSAFQSASSLSLQNLTILENRLTWIVLFIGSMIGGRVSFQVNDDNDTLDGRLICSVLRLMQISDARLEQHGSKNLEVGFVFFFDQFRRIYIGEQVNRPSNVYKILAETLGLTEESMLLDVLIKKILTNLRYWSKNRDIVDETMQLFNNLSIGYTCVRKMSKLDAVKFMLANHNADNFPFLGDFSSECLKTRQLFYQSLGRILLVDLGEDEEKFTEFMHPLTTFSPSATIESMFEQIATNQVQYDEQLKLKTVGLCCDLRGLVLSFTNKSCFIMFFDWLYPKYLPLLTQALVRWADCPLLTTAVLRCVAEIVQNKSQRLMFDVSSPNGILLFREVSKLLSQYGERVLAITDVPDDAMYRTKLKQISLCFQILRSALAGGYVNFGVFQLYGDECHMNAINMFIKLLGALPDRALMEYPKLSSAYYSLMDIVTQDHMTLLGNVDPNVIVYILSTLAEGIASVDVTVSTACCSSLDNVITFIFKKTKRNGETMVVEKLRDIVKMQNNVFQQIMNSIVHIVMYEECKNQWSMSRPLLGLILLNQDYFKEMQQNFVSMQPPDKQGLLAKCFENLMTDVEPNLLGKNRDRLTQNMALFRRDINNQLQPAKVSQTNDIMMVFYT
ncbi:exportin-7-like isoform X3 [Bolinopsis microptera]|uniref:exportin-7-like isoform X3 n=1 Tax=Bolinopsis microptera TaxID=2820187 RepID=UPI00307A69EC